MKIFFLTLFWLILAVMVMAVQPAALLLMSEGNTHFTAEQIKAANMLFASVLGIGVAGFLLLGIIQILRIFIPPPASATGQTDRRLIAFAVTALFFPKALTSLALGVAAAIENLITSMSLMMMDTTANTGGVHYSDETSLASAVAPILPIIHNFSSVLVRFLSSVAESAVSETLILAYAIWLILYFALGVKPDPAQAEHRSPWQRSKHWFLSLSENTRHNLLLAAVFFCGVYMSIAAVVAIPSVERQQSETTATEEKLQAALTGITITKEEFDRNYPETYQLSTNTLIEVDDFSNYVARVETQLAANTNINSANWELPLKIALASVRNARMHAVDDASRWTAFRQESFNKQQALAKQALGAYSIDNLKPMPIEERLLYFQDVLAWHRDNVDQLQTSLKGSLNYLKSTESKLVELVRTMQTLLTSTISSLNSSPASDPSNLLLMEMGRSATQFHAEDEDIIPFRAPIYSPLRTPSPGEFAGPFGFIARWLLDTRSFALTLITGMIGFGLMGASIGKFVRVGLKGYEGDQSSSIVTVLVQGFSAAIVVYLGVQGGLAVFTEGSKELNPYVVCFACLVGAVFSEHVWLWAGKRLQDWLPLKADANRITVTTPPKTTAGEKSKKQQTSEEEKQKAVPPPQEPEI